MRPWTVLAALAVVVTVPVLASGQDISGAQSSELRQELKQKRVIVLPKPAPETVAHDTDQAVNELTERQRVDRLIREGRERPLSRPELDSSVINSIQADRALRQLRR
jgi:hypothetical protein